MDKRVKKRLKEKPAKSEEEKKPGKKKRRRRIQFDDEPVLSDSPKAKTDKSRLKHRKGKGAVHAYDAAVLSGNTGKALNNATSVSETDDRDIGERTVDATTQVTGHRITQKKKSAYSEKKQSSGKKSRLSFDLQEKRTAKFTEGKEVTGEKSSGATLNPKAGKKADTKDTTPKSIGKVFQKRRIKKDYATALNKAKRGEKASGVASKAIGKATDKLKSVALNVLRNHAPVIAIVSFLGFLLISAVSLFSTIGGVLSQAGGGVLTTTYLSSDEDIRNTNTVYEELEAALQDQIDRIENTYPGYDEYRYQVDEISHDPYALTSYLTVLYLDYKASDVGSVIEDLFREQFDLNVTASQETRYQDVPQPDGSTVSEPYTVDILTVTLTNKGIDMIAFGSMDSEQYSLYQTYQAGMGNRPDLFGERLVAGSVAGGGMSYEIPPEALSDTQFANMIHEAEKYLGLPYVWGGYSPVTGFDCSGFVSYVINNCGNGWSLGRQTAEGLRSHCTYVSPANANPGDLIFFERTYNTPGASHVGIYVGEGMMIHCGRPIQFASINSNYWQSHFMCFGRL